MNTKEIQNQEKVNESLKNFNDLANEQKKNVTTPTVAKGGKVSVNDPLSTLKLKSNANAFLKMKHSSLGSVLRTIYENFESEPVQRFIESLKNRPVDFGKKSFPVILSKSDFDRDTNFETIKALYPLRIELNGKWIIAKLSKITEKRGATTGLTGYTDPVNYEKKVIKETDPVILEIKGIQYTLIPKDSFSVWDILTKVIKAKKEGVYQELKQKRDEEKAKKAAEREAAAKEKKDAKDAKAA